MSLHCIVWCCMVLYCWLLRAGCISQDTYLLFMCWYISWQYYYSNISNIWFPYELLIGAITNYISSTKITTSNIHVFSVSIFIQYYASSINVYPYIGHKYHNSSKHPKGRLGLLVSVLFLRRKVTVFQNLPCMDLLIPVKYTAWFGETLV